MLSVGLPAWVPTSAQHWSWCFCPVAPPQGLCVGKLGFPSLLAFIHICLNFTTLNSHVSFSWKKIVFWGLKGNWKEEKKGGNNVIIF